MSMDGEYELDPYQQGCPTRRILDLIGGRWTVLIVGALGDGTLRFSDLQRRVQGISQKMLTQTLRSLERDGFVTRTAYPVVPPHVEYELTPLGRSLQDPLRALERWAVENMDTVVSRQGDYDARGTRALA